MLQGLDDGILGFLMKRRKETEMLGCHRVEIRLDSGFSEENLKRMVVIGGHRVLIKERRF